MFLSKEEIAKAEISIEDIAKFIASLRYRRGDTEKKALVERIVEPVMEEERFAAPLLPEEVYRKRFVITPFEPSNLDYDSIDFIVGATFYSSKTILPDSITAEELEKLASSRRINKVELDEGEKFDFFPGKVYYCLSKETVAIPSNLRMFVDSKSTIGRLGCLCSGVGPEDYFHNNEGKVVAMVRPLVFPVEITAGKSKLFQAVFLRTDKSHMTRKDLLKGKKAKIKVNGKYAKLEKFIEEDELLLRFSTHKAYVSKKFSKKDLKYLAPLDVDARGLDWKPYFEEVRRNRELVLEGNRLYLFGSKEYLEFGSVCARLSRDVGGYSTGLWTQFAGVIHAGFKGTITLECWHPGKIPLTIRDGQKAGRAKIDELSKDIEKFEESKGSYINQDAPQLAKIFKT